MSGVVERPNSYRHVVFPGLTEPAREAFNFTPVPIVAPPPSDDLSDDEHAVVRHLFSEAGLNADDYRPETIKRRITACLRAINIDRVSQLRTALIRRPELKQKAIASLLIGVTSFFRDPAVFDTLAQVISQMTARIEGPKIWCAACSDGAELYSVGMLLAEIGAVQRTTMLGTDFRIDAIAQARQGLYDNASIKTLPARYATRYLRTELGSWRVHPYLRSVTQWRMGNLLADPEPGEWDMILCRNMAIYLQPNAAAALWARLHAALKPGGLLILGKAERPLANRQLRALAPCIYQRVES